MADCKIRTTNWNLINKVNKGKPQPETLEEKKAKIVKKILSRYDLWHYGTVVKKVRELDNPFVTKTIITEAYSLSMLFTAIASNNKTKIKEIINLRINRRAIINTRNIIPPSRRRWGKTTRWIRGNI